MGPQRLQYHFPPTGDTITTPVQSTHQGIQQWIDTLPPDPSNPPTGP